MGNFGFITITAQAPLNEPVKRVVQKIGPYAVIVVLAADNRFLGIESVATEKSFLDLKQRLSVVNSLDIEKYFEVEGPAR